MDNEPIVATLPKENFGKTVAKTFITSTASTAGVFGGMIIAGVVLEKIQRRKKARETESSETTASEQ